MANFKATWKLEADFYELSLDDYPPVKLGFALDKLSVNGKYHTAPIDTVPHLEWKWSYSKEMWPAITTLLVRCDVLLVEQR